MTTSPSATPLYSELGGDPDFGELVEMFVDEMPDRTEALRNAFDGNERETLRQLAHQLKGSSGSYGFDQLTPYAAKLESAIKEQSPEDEVEASLTELLQLCARVRAGAPE